MKPTTMATVTGVLLVFAFIAPALAGRPVPDTGQEFCYDVTGNQISCAGTGQDGELSINPMSYTKLDDTGQPLPDTATDWATVRDNVTGLIWEVKHDKNDAENHANPNDADNRYTWYDSNSATNGGEPGTPGDGTDTEDFINDLNAMNYGGFNDWRLPERKELLTILNFPEGVVSDYFPNAIVAYYWSDTTWAYSMYSAHTVHFVGGAQPLLKEDTLCFARAVRGAKASTTFVDNGDGTVTDTTTGLMWEQKTDDDTVRDKDNTYSWGNIQNNFIAQLNAADPDYDDWRCPNVKELDSIWDLTRTMPAIDPTYFPNTMLPI